MKGDFMEITWSDSDTPYDKIVDIITEWCNKNCYGDFLVTIDVSHDGEKWYRTTQILEYYGDDDTFAWLNDWWEGEKLVDLQGFSPISEISVLNIDYMLREK